MGQDVDRKRTIEGRVQRLKERLVRAKAYGAPPELCAVLAGILDLLEDEL